MSKLPSFTVITTVGAVCGSLLIFKYVYFGRTLRDYINGPVYKGKDNMENKVVVITGANSGIGKETAAILAGKKCRVILACRDMDKCKEVREDIVLTTQNPNVLCKPLNLASLESVEKFSYFINTNEPKLDILINNAAIMNCPQAHTQEKYEAHYGVNYLGHFLLTSLLLPKLKESAPSKIINIIDPLCRKGHLDLEATTEIMKAEVGRDIKKSKYDAFQCYKNSKLALATFSQELHNRLLRSSHPNSPRTDVYCVDPGITDTRLQRYLPSHRSLISRYTSLPIIKFFTKDAYHGAQPVVFCACRPQEDLKPGVDGSVPLVSSGRTGFVIKPLDSVVKVDPDVARKLWDHSVRCTSQTSGDS